MRRLLLVAALAVGCKEPPDYLDGSLSQVLDLSFDHTRARIYASEVSIEYVDGIRDDLVTLRVTVEVRDGIAEGTRYDLLERGWVGTSDSLDVTLPELSGGDLRFSTWTPDDPEDPVAAGRFDAQFDAPDGSRFGVVGWFTAPLEEAPW